ncbi:MAG: HAD-IA family hydrolase [Cyanobacteriota bacterium]
MGRPRALLLDAMGTLIGLRQSVGRTYAAAAAAHGLIVSAEAIDAAFPRLYRQAPPLAFPDLSGPERLQAERRWWGERIEAALQAAGAGPAPEALQIELFERFRDPALWRVYDDVPRSLERWRSHGLQLAVVSNFDSRLHDLLEALGLRGHLEAVVISSEVGAAKPSARPFVVALKQLGVSASEAWHIGDSPEDGQGATAAGLSWLQVQRP